MGYYLIDFENVHDVGLNGVTTLTENDEICIFYSVKSEHMSFDTHVNIMKTQAKVKYIKLRRSARNYLDFQLVTHLGFLIGSNAPGPYYVISKDTGYDSAIDYWRDHGVNVIRQPSISYSRSQGRFPGQPSGQLTPAALVTVQESHQVVSENAPQTLEQIPLNAGIDQAVYEKIHADNARVSNEERQSSAIIESDSAFYEELDETALVAASQTEAAEDRQTSRGSGRNRRSSLARRGKKPPVESVDAGKQDTEKETAIASDQIADAPISEAAQILTADEISAAAVQPSATDNAAEPTIAETGTETADTTTIHAENSSVETADLSSAESQTDAQAPNAAEKKSARKTNSRNTSRTKRSTKTADKVQEDTAVSEMMPSETASENTTTEAQISVADRSVEEISAILDSGAQNVMDTSNTEAAADLHDAADMPNSSSVKGQTRRSGQKKSGNTRSKKQQAAAPSASVSEATDAPSVMEAPMYDHSLEATEESTAAAFSSLPEPYRKRVRTALKGKEIPSAYYASIYKAIMHSYDKLALNNLMVKTFGSSKGGEVYKQIKDIFTDFHQQ